MKISREQKEQNRLALIQAGVELMSAEGLKEASLSRIARQAGLSEPVIYKYFPSKDHLIGAYFAEALLKAFANVESQKDFAELPFSQQLHLLLDALLAQYEPRKKFVEQAYGSLFVSGLSGSLTYLAESKAIFSERVGHWLSGAVEAGEFEAAKGSSFIVELIWDFQLGLTYYWLRDQSDGSMRTLELMDRSLRLMDEVLTSNIIGRLSDLLFFLFREHFIKSVDRFASLTDGQRSIKTRFFKDHGKKRKG